TWAPCAPTKRPVSDGDRDGPVSCRVCTVFDNSTVDSSDAGRSVSPIGFRKRATFGVAAGVRPLTLFRPPDLSARLAQPGSLVPPRTGRGGTWRGPVRGPRQPPLDSD